MALAQLWLNQAWGRFTLLTLSVTEVSVHAEGEESGLRAQMEVFLASVSAEALTPVFFPHLEKKRRMLGTDKACVMVCV